MMLIGKDYRLKSKSLSPLIKYTGIFLIAFLSTAAIHKFYVSVTNVEYAEKDGSLQITTRIFIDDLEEVLNARYEIDTQLNTEDENESSNELISKYLTSKFVIRINGEHRAFEYLGREYRDDLIVCYLELQGISLTEIRSIEIQSDLLTELFEEQQNVVHLKIGPKKKSFILVRENNKGMLNL